MSSLTMFSMTKLIGYTCTAIVFWQIGLVVGDIILARIHNELDEAIDSAFGDLSRALRT